MPRLLHIQSSPNLDASLSRQLTQKLVDKWVSTHANVEVDTLDLTVNAPPHFGPEAMAAAGKAPAEWSDETRAAVALSGALVEQLKAADILGLNRNTLRKKIRELGITFTGQRRAGRR